MTLSTWGLRGEDGEGCEPCESGPCASNRRFSDCASGNYMTDYMSEDGEQRMYNCNWTKNMLGLNAVGVTTAGVAGCGCGKPSCASGGCSGERGCNCGCSKCQHYAWTSFMRSVLDAQGMGHHPACSRVGVGRTECATVPDVLDVFVMQRPPVKQSPCPGPDCWPPGPTNAEDRSASCWWVRNQLGLEGVVMDGIRIGGREVQGLAAQGLGFGTPPGWQLVSAPVIWPVFTPILAPPPGASFPAGYGWQQIVLHGRTYGRTVPPNTFNFAPPTYYVWVGQYQAQQPILRRPQVYASPFLAGLPHGLGGPPPQGLGATAATATSPATVGLVAALGGTVGLIAGAALGSEMGGGGDAATRRAAAGGLIGMLVGSFAGAAISAPSVAAQGA